MDQAAVTKVIEYFKQTQPHIKDFTVVSDDSGWNQVIISCGARQWCYDIFSE